MGAHLEKKQITLISMIIIAFFLLGWQIYKLVSDDIVTSTSNNTVLADNSAVADAMPNDRKIPIKNVVPAPRLVKNLPPVLVAQQNALITNQAHYMELVSQFEMAKVQHKLLGQEVAIAMAKQQIAAIHAKTKTDVTRYSSDGFDVTNTQGETPHYQLAYLDHQNKAWNATLSIDGHYENANVGDMLTDGGTVVKVNNDGVLIDKNQHAYEVTFNGMTSHTIMIKKKKPVPSVKAAAIKKTIVTSAVKPLLPIELNPIHIISNQQTALFHNHVIAKKIKPKSPLFTLPANEFTIHIKEAANKATLDNIIHVYHLEKSAVIYSENKHGKPLYILIYNTYPTSLAAEAALSHLPQALQDQDVWIEQVGMLQQSLN